MPLQVFDPPAFQDDIADPDKAQAFRGLWSNGVARWTQAARLGDPWGSLNDSDRNYYYDPLVTDSSSGSSKLVAWIAFPNRIWFYFSNASVAEQLGYAEGRHIDGTFGPPPNVDGKPYNPVGPRGWQDEYCEWMSKLDANGKITQVDFTCENPEYWFTLWQIDPPTVLRLYRELVSPSVQLDDLFLLDPSGNPVLDRATGKPAYNPVNKWNTEPSAGGSAGVAHLISTPNSVSAEIYLAAAATILRENPPGNPVSDPDILVRCCSKYGQAHRNSDPFIGATVNGVIRGGGVKLSLQNPVGLYIQMPDFSGYQLPPDPKLPADAQPSECWQIIRGKETIPGFTGNFILHARFTIPQRWKDAGVAFTISDIMINGNPIQFGAQITQTFQIGLRGLVITATSPEAPKPCVDKNPNPLPTPVLLQNLNLLHAQSLSPIPTTVEQGQTVTNIGLVANSTQPGATIQFTGDGVTATVTGTHDVEQGITLLILTITVGATAATGDRGLILKNPDGTQGPAAPGLLSVVPAGTHGAAPAVTPVSAHTVATALAHTNHIKLIMKKGSRL